MDELITAVASVLAWLNPPTAISLDSASGIGFLRLCVWVLVGAAVYSALGQVIPRNKGARLVLGAILGIIPVVGSPNSMFVLLGVYYGLLARIVDGFAVGILLRRSLGLKSQFPRLSAFAIPPEAHGIYGAVIVAGAWYSVYRVVDRAARGRFVRLGSAAVASIATVGLLVEPVSALEGVAVAASTLFPLFLMAGLFAGGFKRA